VELQVHQELAEHLVRVVLQEHLAHQEAQELQAQVVHQELAEHLVRVVLQEQVELQVHQELQVQVVLQEQVELQVHQELLEPQELLVRLVQPAPAVKDQLAQLVQPD
jgi:hypothetical protein